MAPRKRHKTVSFGPAIIAPESVRSRQSQSTLASWDRNVSLNLCNEFEELLDENGDYVATNYVKHVKVKTHVLGDMFGRYNEKLHWSFDPQQVGVEVSVAHDAIGRSGIHHADTAWLPAIFPGGTVPPDIDSMIQEVSEEKFPRINMVNTILELGDIPSLFAQIPAGLSKAAADTWLRGKLGVIPSIQDMITGRFRDIYHAQYSQLKQMAEGPGVTVRKNKQTDLDQYWTGSYQSQYRLKGKWSVSYYAKVNVSLPNYSANDIFDFSIGPKNLWEATPLSFVVDYFVPVGNMLSGVTFSDPHIIDMGISSKFEGTYETGRKGRWLCKSKIKQYYRAPTQWGVPDGIRADFDEMFQPLSPQRMATLAALARQLM